MCIFYNQDFASRFALASFSCALSLASFPPNPKPNFAALCAVLPPQALNNASSDSPAKVLAFFSVTGDFLRSAFSSFSFLYDSREY